MIKVTLPISSHDYTPDLPELKQRKLNWMGRIIEWIRLSQNHGLFYSSLIATITVIVSAILIFSVVLAPLFLYAFREMIQQQERERYDKNFANLLMMANENNRINFLKGRLDPLAKHDISLTSSARKQIIKDLDLSKEKEEVKNKTDQELLLAAALKFDNYIERYHFEVRSRSQWAFWRALGY